jgi:hypothetical protein
MNVCWFASASMNRTFINGRLSSTRHVLIILQQHLVGWEEPWQAPSRNPGRRFLDRTALSTFTKHASCATLFVGIGGLVSRFLLHALVGQPNESSIGTVVTLSGAVFMGVALVVLIYGLITTPRLPPTIQ